MPLVCCLLHFSWSWCVTNLILLFLKIITNRKGGHHVRGAKRHSASRFSVGGLPAVSHSICVLDLLALAPPSLLWRSWNKIHHANHLAGLRWSADSPDKGRRFITSPLWITDRVWSLSKSPISQECPFSIWALIMGDLQGGMTPWCVCAHVLAWFSCVSVWVSVDFVHVRIVVCVFANTREWRGAADVFSQAPGQSMKPLESERTAF